MIKPAQRVATLPPYVFLELQQWRDRAREQGVDVIDLSIGNPDGEVPPAALDTLSRIIFDDRTVHGYPAFRGTDELRETIAWWYQRRFSVELDPSREVLPVLGSKEGLYHLMQAFLDPGDTILVPTPCYPAYLGAARLCGAVPLAIPLREDRDFVLDFADIDSDRARGAKALLLNYPHNPTGAIASHDHYRDAVAFARDHDLLLISDIPYSELYLDDGLEPPSLLQLDGARDVTVELQSLSKSHAMAGWRAGFAVGNADALSALARVKANADFGMFRAIQSAVVAALREGEQSVESNRSLYRARRDRLIAALASIGWAVRRPRAGMYLWTRIPDAAGTEDDREFVRELFDRSGVLISPGSAFGESARGWVRMSLVADGERLDEVARRIGASGVVG
jgi:LL-diaminopimelate aminotransferase